MGRELDAQIDLHVMGACGRHDWEEIGGTVIGGLYIAPSTYCRRCEREKGVYSTPAYSTDLNACAEAEQRIISMGLGKQYGIELMIVCLFEQDDEEVISIIRKSLFGDTLYPIAIANVMSVATAPAEARCRAMLRALEQEGK